jgi:hypothetical protein
MTEKSLPLSIMMHTNGDLTQMIARSVFQPYTKYTYLVQDSNRKIICLNYMKKQIWKILGIFSIAA